jgi:predicted metal-dependent peptidase
MEFDIYEVRAEILEKCPEWIDLMNAVEFRNTSDTDSAGYSGNRVLYNSFRMRQFSREAQKFLIAGQLMHIQFDHQQRGMKKDSRIWDAACSAVVNELLINDGFEPPANAFRHKDAANISVEELYDILCEEADWDPDESSELQNESEDQNEETAEVTEYAEPADNDDSLKRAGDLQGAQVREIKDPGLAQAVAGLSDLLEVSLQMEYDWFPADRIRDGVLKEQFRPYPVPHAEILLDTSASIDSDLLRAFVRGVKGLLSEDAVVKVGCFDTEFYGFQEIRSEKDIADLEIKGSGGTNFETAVKAFSGDAETRIVFTDGYADMPETRCDAIWLVYSDMPVDPPGGRVIYVKKPEDLNNYEINFLIT